MDRGQLVMKQSYKNRWIKALRSGQYVKHDNPNFRREGDAFDCVGVLLDINLHQGYYWDSSSIVSNCFNIEKTNGRKIMWSELGFPNLGQPQSVEKKHSLSFNEMADWIESNL